jgi:hypothetical protein
VAAQDLCSGLPPYLKTHHVQAGVGHYGVFNGSKWEKQIYPIVRATIHDNEPLDANTSANTSASTTASDADNANRVTLWALLNAQTSSQAVTRGRSRKMAIVN